LGGPTGYVCSNCVTTNGLNDVQLESLQGKFVTLSQRAKHEIDHGKTLAQVNTEQIWGWGTPAGRLRAERRAGLITTGARLSLGTNVLEIGCGTGMFTEIFAQTGAQLVAVDISPDLIEKALKRDLPQRQVQFLAKRFENCDVDGPFDAVIGSSILHHLDIEPSLAKIYKLLKPGGRISFAEPNMLNPQVFIERKFNFLPLFWYVSPDETAFVRWQLRRLLLQSGFEDIDITPFDWLHPAAPKPIINFVGRIGRLLEKTPLLREFSGSLIIRARRPLAR
jgi:2-polyprenyl-3-methyl-5-hydroxy-6-metoxy-1,4-benzoquinol methylase